MGLSCFVAGVQPTVLQRQDPLVFNLSRFGSQESSDAIRTQKKQIQSKGEGEVLQKLGG